MTSRSDREIHRTALRVAGTLALRGLVPLYGTIQVGRTSHGYWCALIEPLPLPGEEWKG